MNISTKNKLHNRFKILDVNISDVNLEKACATVDDWIKAKQKEYVCVVPVSTIMSCQEDEEYKGVINNSGMSTPDGMPVVWLARSRGYKEVKRTYGPDLMLALCEKGLGNSYRHYFYGGTKESGEKLTNRLSERFREINIVGNFSPPFRELSEDENNKVIEDINNTNPDILWIGLGSPKQDFWMKKNRDKLNVPVIIGVGAAFDFISGVKPQAPRWIRSSGLEWLFRLCCEPKRLWKRYLVGNTKFVYLLIKEINSMKRENK